jgi:hypothetical protein
MLRVLIRKVERNKEEFRIRKSGPSGARPMKVWLVEHRAKKPRAGIVGEFHTREGT